MAEHLGKFRYEVMAMPCDEFDGWFLYFDWKNKEQKKNAKKQNNGKKVTTI